MSDRYDEPRRDDERSRLDFDPQSSPDDDALEAASENVLDGWPSTDAAASPLLALDDAESASDSGPEPASGVETGFEPDLPPDAEPEPGEAGPATALADHVSATMEHAPGDLTVPPGYSVLDGEPVGERRAVGVVVARFNGDVTTQLLERALSELEACGVAHDAVTVMPVPGAFELPLAAMALAKTRRFACIVALGCVIRGDTPHFDYVSSEAASGIQLAAIETGVPVAFGVLTLDRADQAESRVDKGAEAVRTALEMADVFANLRAAAAR
jgi:6,7-dimethyl-8-ribityllumazine synthase